MPALKDKIGFVPHWGQEEVLKCQNKIIVISAGRRWGKTLLCAYIVLKELWKPNKKIWIVAGSYELTYRVFDQVALWVAKILPKTAAGISRRPPKVQITMPNGSWVQGKSAENPDSLLGEELDLVIIDEAAILYPEVWERYIQPTLISRGGRVIFISTPRGQNWFWKEFERAKEDGGAFHFRTQDNPTLGEEGLKWIDHYKATVPARVYAQEIEASFEPEAASIFPHISDIVQPGITADYKDGHKYIMGVDLGRYEDYTCIAVIDTYNNHVVYGERFTDIEFPIQKARIKGIAQRYGNARIIIDSSAIGIPIVEDLRRESLFVIDDFKFSGKSKGALVDKAIVYTEQKGVWLPPDEETQTPFLRELQAFGYHLTEKGNVTYGAPQGMHDDCAIAFMLAVWGLQGKAHPQSPIKQLLKGQIKKIDNFV